MDNINTDLGMSLHSLRAMFERKCEETDKDFIKRQNHLLKRAGFNRNLTNKRANDARIMCFFLGEEGWAVCPFGIPKINEHWYDTWFWMAYNNSAELIKDYFINDNYYLLKEIINYSCFEVDRADWLREAEILFNNKHYTSCAMLLTAILEQSIRKCPIEKWRQQVTKFFDDAVQKNIEDYYNNKSIEPFNRYVETCILLPSLDGFINSYFNSRARFEEDNEPPHLERNWLMHGQTKRKITEPDCIKLFNVVCSLNYVLHTIFQTDYRQ